MPGTWCCSRRLVGGRCPSGQGERPWESDTCALEFQEKELWGGMGGCHGTRDLLVCWEGPRGLRVVLVA